MPEPPVPRPDSIAARWRALGALAPVALGVWLAHAWPGASHGVGFAAALAALSLAAFGLTVRAPARRIWVCLALAMGALAFGWAHARLHSVPADSVERLIPRPVGTHAPEMLADLEFRVRSRPEAWPERTVLDPRGQPGWSLDVGVMAIYPETGARPPRRVPCRGTLRLHVPGESPPEVEIGERFRAKGWLRRPDPGGNPGSALRGVLERASGRSGSLAVASQRQLRPLPRDRGLIGTAADAWRIGSSWTRDRALRALGPPEGRPDRALIRTVLLGERGLDDGRSTFDTFRDLGALHLLSVSGLHVGLVAWLALLAVRLSGERGRLEGAIVVAVLLLYLFVLPVRVPVVRAGAMAIALIIAGMTRRGHDRLSVLLWVAVGVLVWRPSELFSIGAQLTFGVTGALLILAERHGWARPPVVLGSVEREHVPLWGRALGGARSAAEAAVLAFVVATPVILAHRGDLTPLAPVASLALTPLITLDLAAGGVVAMAGVVWPGAAEVLRAVTDQLGALTLWASSLLSTTPNARTRLELAPIWWVAVAMIMVAVIIRRNRVLDRVSLLAISALALSSVVWLATARSAPVLRVDALRVGDGTLMVLRSRGETLVWDAGSLSRRANDIRAPRALRALGVTRIDTLVVSHPNLDHANLAPALGREVEIGRVLTGDATLEAIASDPAGGIAASVSPLPAPSRLELGDVFGLGACRVEVLGPPAGERPTRWMANDRSLVLLVRAPTRDGERRVLLTGDVQRAGIVALLDSEPGLTVDVLEAPHHGSDNPAAQTLRQRLSPSVVLQSTGPSRIDARRPIEGGVWWTTAAHGWAWAEFDRDGIVTTGAMRTADGINAAR